MIYSTNRIDYTEDVDMTPKSSTFISMNLDEVSLLFEDINNTIFETFIEADFNEALALREEGENKSSNDSSSSNNNSSSDNKDESSSTDNNSSAEKKEESKDKEEKKKSLWEKVKSFFNTIIEKLKGLFASLQDKFMHVIDMDKKLYDKYSELFTMDNMKNFEPIEDCLDLNKVISLDKEYGKLINFEKEYDSIMNPNSSDNSSNKEEFEKLYNLAKEYNDKNKEIFENKIKWKPESDNDIKIIINHIVQESGKSLKESQEILKNTVEQLEKNIKAMDSEVQRVDTEKFKELIESKIKATKEIIYFLNTSINAKKQVYKDTRKKFITMLNWAKKHKDGNKSEDENKDENKENKSEEKSTEESAYNFLLADRSDMYLESALDDYSNSAFQSAIYIVAEAESKYNNLFKSIGIAELKEFVEIDNISLYEGARFDSIKEAIINFFKGIIERIKKFYNDIVNRIDKTIHKFWNKIGSNLKEIKSNEINELDNDKIVKNIGIVYKYDLTFFHKINLNLKNMVDKISKDNEMFIKNGVSQEEINNYKNNIKSSFIKNATEIDTTDLNELKSKLKDKSEEKIDITKSYLVKNWNFITDSVKGGNIKRQLKITYNNSIEMFNKAINNIEKSKGEDSTSYIIQTCSSLIKNISSCAYVVNTIHIDLVVKQFRINQMIAFKVAKMLGKTKFDLVK